MSPVEQQQVTIPSLALLILLSAISIAAPDIEKRLDFVSNLALNTRDVVASIKESMQRLQSLAAPHPQAGRPPEEEGFEVPVVEPEE
ncbi:MAG: hypothetical protein ACUVSP_10525 [Desulfotomaculales bacterium]